MRHKDIPILAYSDIATSSPDRECVLLNDFRKQIEFLKKNDYECITLTQLKEYLENRAVLPDRLFSISFIGNKKGFLYAVETLAQDNVSATWFIDPKQIGKDITWDEIKDSSIKLELGLKLTRKLDVLTQDEIIQDLSQARLISEKTEKEVIHVHYELASYENFQIIKKIKDIIKAQGFQTATTDKDLLNNRFLDSFELCQTKMNRTINLGSLRTLLTSPTLAVCMIVKDEESCLKSCLESIKDIADEIIIVDTGSTDRTKDIAKEYNTKISEFRWNNNFSDARNFSLKQATSDWILVLDADELFKRENLVNIKKLLTLDFDAFRLILKNYSNNDSDIGFIKTDSTSPEFSGYLPVHLPRLFKNRGFYYKDAVHETLDESLLKKKAKIGDTDIPIEHLEVLKGTDAIRQKQLNYMEYAKKRLEQNPDDLKALCDIGVIAMNFEQDYEKAKQYFKKAISINSNFARAHLLLGQLYARQSKYTEAINQYELAAKIDKESELIAKDNIRKLREIALNQST